MQFDNLTILVADDNEHILKMLCTILRSLKVGKILQARDGEEAFTLLATAGPDMLICDWNMKPMDGITFSRKVRLDPDSPNRFIPIIMVTAHSETHRVMEARDAGVNSFIVKPISLEQIYRRITNEIIHPRPFIQTDTYFGPDRRWRQDPDYTGPFRRKTDTGQRILGEQPDIVDDTIELG